MKHFQKQLDGFFREVAEDPCMTSTHVSLYTALLHTWMEQGSKGGTIIHRHDVMRCSKLSRTTFQKSMQELQEYGYIQYTPSFNHFLGSLVSFAGFPECILTIKITRHAVLFNTR